MTQEHLVELLTADFYENFAAETARQVREADGLAVLYMLVTEDAERFSRNIRHKILFRGAYVLERIYFDAPEAFAPFAERFCRSDFVDCADPSARRHFGKIMAHLLQNYMPEQSSLERIAEAAAEWAVDAGAKVAVRIWAVEVLKCCRVRIDWVDESWDDLVGAMEADATPGIRNRMRKSWRPGQ